MLEIISIYQGLICVSRCYLSWRNFHVLLRKKWNMLFLDEMPYRYQLGPTGSMYHLKLCFLINFLSGRSVCLCESGIKVLHYYCVTVKFPFNTCYHLPYVLWCFKVGCIYVYNGYIFFLDWYLDYYKVSFLPLVTDFILKSIYLSWVLLLLLSFDFCLHGISSSSPSLSVSVCP